MGMLDFPWPDGSCHLCSTGTKHPAGTLLLTDRRTDSARLAAGPVSWWGAEAVFAAEGSRSTHILLGLPGVTHAAGCSGTERVYGAASPATLLRPSWDRAQGSTVPQRPAAARSCLHKEMLFI